MSTRDGLMHVARDRGDAHPLIDSILGDALSWVTPQALCAQADPEEWHPDKGGSAATAKRLCLGCPLQTSCLEYAIENGERYGVWGGFSERERRDLVKRRRLDAA